MNYRVDIDQFARDEIRDLPGYVRAQLKELMQELKNLSITTAFEVEGVMSHLDLTLIINAGGQSRRMGKPKALLPLPPTNEPLLQVIYRRLQPLSPQHTVVIANDPSFRAQVALPHDVLWLTDAYPNTGPLGGLATGLAAYADWAICVACDMPLLNPALFAYFCTLAAEPNPYGGEPWDAVIPVVNDYPEPLHALYHPRCLPVILACLAKGERRATAFLPAVRVRYVHEAELRQFDPELHSFLNANTPDDWAQAVVLTQQRMREGTDVSAPQWVSTQ